MGVSLLQDRFTVREYMEWTQVFPYTQEYFNIRKESSELELLGLCIESNKFMTENSSWLKKESLSSFFESGVTLEAAEENFLSKLGNVLTWILKVVSAPFRAVGRVLQSTFSKTTEKKQEMIKKTDEVINNVESGAIPEEELQKQLPAVIEEAIVILSDQPPPQPQPEGGETPQTTELVPIDTTDEEDIRVVRSWFDRLKSAINKEQFLQLLKTIRRAMESSVKIEVPGIIANVDQVSHKVGLEITNLRNIFSSGDQAQADQVQKRDPQLEQLIELINGMQREKVKASDILGKIQKLQEEEKRITAALQEMIKMLRGAQEDIHDSRLDNKVSGVRRVGYIVNQITEFLKVFNQRVGDAIKTMTDELSKPSILDRLGVVVDKFRGLFRRKAPDVGEPVEDPEQLKITQQPDRITAQPQHEPARITDQSTMLPAPA